MKRNILLLFCLTGLISIEYGCDDNSGQNGSFEITGIESTILIKTDSFGQDLGPVDSSSSYNRFKIQTTFTDEFVVASSYSNYATYADLIQPVPSLMLELDSIKITNIAAGDSLDVTSSFELGVSHNEDYKIKLTNDEIFRNETRFAVSYSPLVYNLDMIVAPSVELEYQFEIKLL